MTAVDQPFNARLRRIVRRHRQLSTGYTIKLDSNNLLVARPHYLTPAFPWRGVAMVLLVGFTFKAYLIAALGDATYQNRVDSLSEGHLVEQVGAFVMQADPASQKVAVMMRQMGI